MNDAAYVDYGPPAVARNIPDSLVYTDSEYWAWNDARWVSWGVDFEATRYPISDIWERLLRSAGFEGEIYRSVDVEIGIGPDGVPSYGSVIKVTDEAKRAIDALRARGFDVRRKHPDRRTYNTYWGLFGPDGLIQDIKIEGDDGSANLLKAVLFTMPGWIGPLAGALSVPAPVLGTGIKLAAGADPLRTIVGAALPVVADTIMPSVSVLPDTSIGEILPADEWLTTGAALPTIDTGFMGPILPTIDAGADIVAELVTAPELLPVIEPPGIEPDYRLGIDEPLVWDAADSWGPVIETVEVVEAPPQPVFVSRPRGTGPMRTTPRAGKFADPEITAPSPVVEPVELPPPPPVELEVFDFAPLPVEVSTLAPVIEPEPLPVTEPVVIPKVQPMPVAISESPLREVGILTQKFLVDDVNQSVYDVDSAGRVNYWGTVERWESIYSIALPSPPPPAFEPEPVQFEPVPVVELPPVEAMAPIPTIDAAPPTIEPVEVFTQPPEVPAVYENEFLFNVDESGLFPEFEGPVLVDDPFAALDDFSLIPVIPGDPSDVQIPDYGWGEPGDVFPPAYDVVTVDEASQLPTDILVGGNGGGVVEVGGNFLPSPSPADPGLSVGQILRDANAIMLDALKLVDSYRRLTNPQTPNRVAQARVGSSTVRATPGGLIETIDASGRVTRRKPPVGQPQMTTDGSMIVNNGDGTYTSISPSGAMSTNRYPAEAGATAPGGYSTALLIGGAVLALAVLS